MAQRVDATSFHVSSSKCRRCLHWWHYILPRERVDEELPIDEEGEEEEPLETPNSNKFDKAKSLFHAGGLNLLRMTEIIVSNCTPVDMYSI